MLSLLRSWFDRARRAPICSQRYRPGIEMLESRLAPATHTWKGLADNPNWSSPANWVNDSPPALGETDIVLIYGDDSDFGSGLNESKNDIPNLNIRQIQITAGGSHNI